MLAKQHILFLSIVTIFLLLPQSAAAASKLSGKADNYHFGYVSVGGGYTSISQEVPGTTIKGSGALLGGVGYEFRHNSFWLSVGAQYMLEKSSLTASGYATPRYEGMDDMGEHVLFQYYINQEDQQNLSTIDIPLMVGYYYSGFYIGAGAKVGFSCGTKINTNGTYRLTGLYDNGMILDNVNYYTTYPNQNTTNCTLRPQFALIGEVGYDLLSAMLTQSNICHVLKLGFYFEYGLTNMRPKESLPILDFTQQGQLNFEKNDARKANINPYILTEKTAQQKLSPFMVGVKLTYMIGGNREGAGIWHKGCQCYGL